MKKISIKDKLMLTGIVLLSAPELAFAQTAQNNGPIRNFSGLVAFFIGLIKQTIPLIISLTVLVFLWGIFKLVVSGDSEDKRNEAKTIMFYGIVSLFVMVSVWGLVRILTGTFFNGQFYLPQLRQG